MTGDELRTARSIKRNARARECKPKGNVARGIRDLGSIGTLCPCCLFYRLPEDSDKNADAPVDDAVIQLGSPKPSNGSQVELFPKLGSNSITT